MIVEAGRHSRSGPHEVQRLVGPIQQSQHLSLREFKEVESGGGEKDRVDGHGPGIIGQIISSRERRSATKKPAGFPLSILNALSQSHHGHHAAELHPK